MSIKIIVRISLGNILFWQKMLESLFQEDKFSHDLGLYDRRHTTATIFLVPIIS